MKPQSYRGISKETDKMIYGNGFLNSLDNKLYIINEYLLPNGLYKLIYTKIIPETYGISIEKTDRDDQQLFTGDILKSGSCIFHILYDYNSLKFVLRYLSGETNFSITNQIKGYLKIGNIHKNKELLPEDF